MDFALNGFACHRHLFSDVYSEKVDPNLKEEIKAHEPAKLRHTDTIEKNVLPTHEGDACLNDFGPFLR